jgi:hypothetical protein
MADRDAEHGREGDPVTGSRPGDVCSAGFHGEHFFTVVILAQAVAEKSAGSGGAADAGCWCRRSAQDDCALRRTGPPVLTDAMVPSPRHQDRHT